MTVQASGQVWIKGLFGRVLVGDLRCGSCGFTWHTELPMMDEPQAICPNCRTVNVVPIEVRR